MPTAPSNNIDTTMRPFTEIPDAALDATANGAVTMVAVTSWPHAATSGGTPARWRWA